MSSMCGLLLSDKDITSLERSKKTDVERQRRIVGSLIVYSIVIYISGAILLYFYFMPTRWFDRLFYCLPFIIFPLLWVFFCDEMLFRSRHCN